TALANEFAEHADLVRGNFIDTYQNLTYKHVMGFRWVLMHCPQAHFIMKSDDDAFIDMQQVFNQLANSLKLPETQFKNLIQSKIKVISSKKSNEVNEISSSIELLPLSSVNSLTTSSLIPVLSNRNGKLQPLLTSKMNRKQIQ